MADSKRRLTTILAADVVGYSRLMAADEEATLGSLRAYRTVFGELADRHGGRIVNTTGDAILAEFGSTVEAVRCAISIQEDLAARNAELPDERRMWFRIGINVGDVIAEGDDIFGDGVNVAARLEGLAEKGGICISRSVFDQVKQKVPLEVEDLGDTALKNIEEPVRTYRIVRAAQVQQAAMAQNVAVATPQPLPPLPRRPSVAILPFRNLNGDPQTEYISSGIGLGIQTLMVQLSGLFLVNASAHQGYRDGKMSAAEATAELPVRYVLEGAVQTAEQRVRVSVHLSDLNTGAMIWGDTYDHALEDVFALQDDVTRKVLSALSSEVVFTDLDRIWTQSLSGSGAWEYFLRGVSHFYKQTKYDNAVAREMFEKIFRLHPDKGIGPAYVAVTHWYDAARDWTTTPAESLRKAREWAERSIGPNEGNNGLGFTTLGSIRVRERRHDEGLALCRKGVAFRANCPLSLGQLAEAQLYCGDPYGAVKTAREALAVRMNYPASLINVLAIAYRDTGEIDLSIRAAREAARLEPEQIDPTVTLCSDYVLAGLDVEARRLAERITEIHPGFRVSEYASNLPYQDSTKAASIGEMLRSAGVPN